MFKKSFALLMALMCLFLCSCSNADPYKLTLVAGEDEDSQNYIYYDDERTVYEVGGIMMSELDGESIMLETALYDGRITIADILTSAQTDADNEDIAYTSYPDGSVEYHYESFNLVVLNSQGNRDIYFLPTSLNYYSVVN